MKIFMKYLENKNYSKICMKYSRRQFITKVTKEKENLCLNFKNKNIKA